MLKAKEAKFLSSYMGPAYDVESLLENIEKYLKEACDSKKTEMSYMVDGAKWWPLSKTKKAIRILKRNGYKVKKHIIKPSKPNYPTNVELIIKWW